MISHQQQKRLRTGEGAGAPDGVAVAQRLLLLDELQSLSVRPGGGPVGLAVARIDDDADFLRAGIERLLDDDGQRGLGFAVAVHELLQWQRPLARPGGSDDGFSNLHRFFR